MNDYPEANALVSHVQENKRDQLVRLKKDLLSRVEDIDRALILFEKFPEIEELTNLLRRI